MLDALISFDCIDEDFICNLEEELEDSTFELFSIEVISEELDECTLLEEEDLCISEECECDCTDVEEPIDVCAFEIETLPAVGIPATGITDLAVI